MRLMIWIALILICNKALAGSVDTVTIYSAAMRKSYKCVVVKPDSYKKKKNTFPSVYLLHGYGGSFRNWISRVPQLKDYADTYQTLIICPEGDNNSWYFDSPVDSSRKFETFIAKEVPAYIEKYYRTIKDRRARAITGLSMGGHGGLFLGFRYAGFFGACGSMSGALAIEYITRGYNMNKILGDTLTNRRYYKEYSIMHEMERYPKDSLAIIIDCGTEDIIIEMSRMAHQKMLKLKIPHEYIERPGAHNWSYWSNAIEYQLLFFRNYFNKMNAVKNKKLM